MKRLILLVGFALVFSTGDAKTIHWLTFIDTTDEKVGQIDILGRQILYTHFVNEINAALAPKGYTSDIQDFYGVRTSPENCKSAIQGLRIDDPDDIIVFYYIGHGGRPVTNVEYINQHPWPQMLMAQSYDEKLIPLEWVDEELKSKGARLAVTIGMCCNALDQHMSPKEAPLFSPNYGASYMSGNKIARIQELFLNYKGSVIATSASPTQYSYCCNTGFGVIDGYTFTMCYLLELLDDTVTAVTWDSILEWVSAYIDENTSGKQTPFHKTSLAVATTPDATVPKVPTDEQVEKTKQQQTPNTTKQQGDEDNWVNDLSKGLAALINTNVDEDDRIRLERKMNELFANDAQVKMLSQDGDTIIDREGADVFLGRLATSRLLLNVAVVEGTFDENHKIKTLKVREVYKQ